jgi:hypothetical protein
MAKTGYEFVREHFLLHRRLRDYFTMLLSLVGIQRLTRHMLPRYSPVAPYRIVKRELMLKGHSFPSRL